MDAAEHAQQTHHFETERAEIRSRLNKVLAPGQMATDAQLEQLRTHCLFYRDHMTLRYGPPAETARRAGQAQLQEMQQNAATEQFRSQQQTLDMQRRARNESNRMFMASNFPPPGYGYTGYGPPAYGYPGYGAPGVPGTGCPRCGRPFGQFPGSCRCF